MWEYGNQYYVNLATGIIPASYLKEQFLNLQCVSLKCYENLDNRDDSVLETDPPVWTDEHIAEMIGDFYLIPREVIDGREN